MLLLLTRFILSYHGMKGRCLVTFSTKLPPGSVLLGRDLGDVFVELLGKVKYAPKPVYVTTLLESRV